MDPTLAGRYLADQLTDEERTVFEQRLCSDPEVARELEAVARLKAGMAELQARGELAGLLPLARAGQSPRRTWYTGLALAASIAALAVGVTLWHGRAPQRSPFTASLSALQGAAGHGFSATASLQIMRMRSAGDDATMPAPQAGAAVHWHVLPDAGAVASHYQVSLRREGGDAAPVLVATGGPFDTGADGFLDFYLSAEELKPGRYLLELAPVGTGGAGTVEVQSFSIKVHTADEARGDSVQ